jgi:tripartite-type tricarboxylate transporter receptor subunit TctC
VTGSTRSAVIPDVPTITEAGVGFEFVGWWGLFVPAKTPRAVVDVIHREAVNALNAPDIRSRLLAMGQEVLGTTPEEFAAKYRENLAQFARIVREGRIPLQD